MLLQVDRCSLPPGRHAGQRELDDAIERGMDLVEGQHFLVQITGETASGSRRTLADHQAADVLRAGLRLGDKEAQIEQGQLIHGGPLVVFPVQGLLISEEYLTTGPRF